jgi:2-deoxy-D-gluconate 3-dehydrogenase
MTECYAARRRTDLAGIAVFLASAASDFVTGAAIPVDGGFASQG